MLLEGSVSCRCTKIQLFSRVKGFILEGLLFMFGVEVCVGVAGRTKQLFQITFVSLQVKYFPCKRMALY